MELTGERLIPASRADTWAALNDPTVLKSCIAGCESLDSTGPDAFAAVVALRVGPVSARFKGNLQMTNIAAPTSYTINFDGQGGVAGFGKGSADVGLSEQGAQTLLKYTARAQVGGKMAQVGSRLIDAAAGKITEDFFKAFEAHLLALNPQIAADAAAATTSAASPSTAVTTKAQQPGNNTIWYVVGAVVVLVALYLFSR
jgi:uncharacterized protein